jgi:hypothetical protein
MHWGEIQVRVGQEFHKRSDLIRYQFGARDGTLPPISKTADRSGQFFFSSGELSGRAALLRKHLPDEVTGILREADAICAHRFRLLGYENLDFASGTGSEIDWHFDPVHGKRAPLDPWFKIPFLDFDVVGDHKVTWELNRHQHLLTLAKAGLMSRDKRYVSELMAQWRSWVKANPYPLGINWGSTLEVAFRSLSWIWVDHLLADSPENEQFRAELWPRLAFHGRYIERYLSTYFSPNTHLLGEALALFFLGTLYPQMSGASRWKKSGWDILLREANRQVRPDGVYFEQSLHYHVYALDFFLHARLLAARNEMEIPAEFDAVLSRMLEVVAALAQAGPAEGFGDDDGGRLFNPRRNCTEHMTDPLALGAVTYGSTFAAAHLTEEAVWLFGNHAVENLASESSTLPAAAAHSLAFPDGGLYVLADSEPFVQEIVVDGGPQGVGRSGHGHADALSLRLTMNGRRWLVDSGSGVYISKDPADRNLFRGTAAHNTMLVDGVDQAVADEPFSWTHIPTTRVENWIAGNSFTYFVGSHNGYLRLGDPVLHRRHVLKIAGGPWLVRDLALGQADHELDVRWHFTPGFKVETVSARQVAIFREDSLPGAAMLSMIVPQEASWLAMEKGVTTLSPAYGALQSAPLVRGHGRVLLPAEIATALLPGGVAMQQLGDVTLTSTAHATVQLYELDNANTSHAFFFALGDEPWTCGPWSSDARVLYRRLENEKLAHIVLIGGSYALWEEQPLLRSATAANFEWRGGKSVDDASPPAFSVTPLFEELTSGLDSPLSRSSLRYAEKH